MLNKLIEKFKEISENLEFQHSTWLFTKEEIEQIIETLNSVENEELEIRTKILEMFSTIPFYSFKVEAVKRELGCEKDYPLEKIEKVLMDLEKEDILKCDKFYFIKIDEKENE